MTDCESFVRNQFAELSNELRGFADKLDSLASIQAENSPGELRLGHPQVDSRKLAAAAKHLYQLRRIRERKLSNDIFGEPAWDMLLDLFIADQEGRRLQVTSVCIGAAVPCTTALRWLGVLQYHHLIEREDDPGDARRTYITLSAHGRQRMTEIVGAMCINLK